MTAQTKTVTNYVEWTSEEEKDLKKTVKIDLFAIDVNDFVLFSCFISTDDCWKTFLLMEGCVKILGYESP